MQSTRLDLIVLRGTTLVIIFLLGLLSVTTAANDPEIDASQLLQDIVLQDKDAGDRTKLVDKIVDGRNLFESSLAFETYTQAQNHVTTLDKVYEHLTSYMEYCPGGTLLTKENTEQNSTKEVYLHPHPRTSSPQQITLTKRDVVNIYTLSSAGMGVLGNLNNQRVFSFEEVSETDDAFQESCKWIVGCQEGMQKINFDGSEIKVTEVPPLSAEERGKCEFIVTDLFNLYSEQVEVALTYDQNRDREIYYNNILEEDRGQICDVNQELEKIGKMLSSTTVDLPKYSYYDPQQVPKNSSGSSSGGRNDIQVRLPSEYETEEEDIPDESSFENIQEDIPYTGVPDETTTRDVSADYLGATNNGKKVVGPSGASGGNTDRLLAKPEEGGLSSLIKTPKPAISDQIGGVGVIQNPQCEVDELGTEDQDIDLLNEATDLTETIQDYASDLDKQERLSQALANPKLLTNLEQVDHHKKDEPLIDTAQLQADVDQFVNTMAKTDDPDELAVMEQMVEDVKSCISQFTEEDPASWRSQVVRFISSSSEVRECIQEIFCKEIVDPSGVGLYSVRFCSRITKLPRTPTTKKVTSLLDSLQTIYASAKTMTTSGRMVKHKQATEALEGQIADLKFKDMFSFTLNIMQRTPRTTTDSNVADELKRQEFTEIKKVTTKEVEDLSILHPFINEAILYSETRVSSLEQDLQISTDFKGSLQQANDIIFELDRSSDQLADYYRRATTNEQIQHGNLIMAEHIEFRQDMLTLAGEMREELARSYKKMKSQ